MSQNTEALPEIGIEEFRGRYPNMFSDPAVDEIYCDHECRLTFRRYRMQLP